MTSIERIKVVWQGAVGLPGVSVFHGTLGASANADVKTFFTALVGSFPSGLTWTVPSTGDVINDTNGALVGTWVNAGGGTVAATNASAYAAGTGAYVNWNTGIVVGGRRLAGRTFLAPIVTALYDAGTITNVNLAAIQTAATALATAGNTLVWHRNHIGLSDGSSSAIVSASVPDQVTSLRTRRR
jgi:hypothetical protein